MIWKITCYSTHTERKRVRERRTERERIILPVCILFSFIFHSQWEICCSNFPKFCAEKLMCFNCHCSDRVVAEWNGMGLKHGMDAQRGVRVAVVKAYDKWLWNVTKCLRVGLTSRCQRQRRSQEPCAGYRYRVWERERKSEGCERVGGMRKPSRDEADYNNEVVAWLKIRAHKK